MGKPQVSNFGRYKNYAGVISKPKPRKSGYVDVMVEKKYWYYIGMKDVPQNFGPEAETTASIFFDECRK